MGFLTWVGARRKSMSNKAVRTNLDCFGSTHRFRSGAVSVFEPLEPRLLLSSAPVLGAWDPIVYRGRVHSAHVGFGLAPLDWLGVDGSYGLVIVKGSHDQVVHRFTVDARFRVYKEIRLGVGYLGRVFADDLIPEDDYAGHVFRILVSGAF